MLQDKAMQPNPAIVPRPGVTNGRSRWAAALESLVDAEKERFNLATAHDRTPQEVLSDVLEAANQKKTECMQKRWRIKVKGRTIILRDVLGKITTWVNKFAAIGTAITANDPLTAALPWAVIRFILQAGVNDVEIFGSMLQSIETISNQIANTAILEELYLNPCQKKLSIAEKLSDSILILYAAILRYLSDTIRYFSHHTATRFVKSVATTKAEFETNFDPINTAKVTVWESARLAEAEKASWILESVDNIEANQQLQLKELHAQLQKPIDRISDQLSKIDDGLERENRIEILRSISTIPIATHHKAARKGRLEGSGQWLLENQAFEAWRTDSTSSVLWLHGIPGSGKTKLASLVIDELTKSDNLAYFYCMRNPAEPQRGQCHAILASLVRQLASFSADSPVIPPIVALYQGALDGIEGFDDIMWTSDESYQALLELLNEWPAVTLVFDALDEVNQEDRQEIMDLLSELLRESPNLLKIFISSRENYDIALHFKGCPNIYIDAQDNKGDIETFISDRLTTSKLLRGRLTPALEIKIKDTLMEKAHGMFRWVDLQIQSLRPLKIAADIEARLGVLPTTLEESYWGIYQDILESGAHAADLAMFTFQWVLYAKGSVTTRQFVSLASEALSSDDMAQSFTEEEIIDVCANLVIKRDGVLEFAHLSVREFLEGLPNRSVMTLLAEPSHGRIAAACLKYMLSHFTRLSKLQSSHLGSHDSPMTILDFEKPLDAGDRASVDYSADRKDLPTSLASLDALEPKDIESVDVAAHNDQKLEYPTLFWIDHAAESGQSRTERPLKDLIREFIIDGSNRAVSDHFLSWIQRVRESSPRFDMKLGDICQHPPNPMWLACIQGWLEIIQYLHEINYNGIGGLESPSLHSWTSVSVDQNEHLTPLLYAVTTGNFPLAECIVDVSLDSHLSLQPRTKLNETDQRPLVRAAEAGDQKLVNLLLKKEHGGFLAETKALAGAAKNGRLDTCRILLDHSPNVVHEGGQYVLRVACGSGHDKVVALLLDRGFSSQEAVEGFYMSASSGYSGVLREILTRGFGKKEMSKALIIATSNADEASIAVLREFGAEMEPAAVLRATREDTPLTALRLIEQGFKIQGRWPKTGQVPLHFATLFGRDKVVAAILNAGAVVNVYDNQGQTPLHLAAKNGLTECARVLLDHNADMLAKDDEGRTPLDLASKHGMTDCKALLRERMGSMEPAVAATSSLVLS